MRAKMLRMLRLFSITIILHRIWHTLPEMLFQWKVISMLNSKVGRLSKIMAESKPVELLYIFKEFNQKETSKRNYGMILFR